MKKILFIILILSIFLSCQKISKEKDIEIINQIFPELIIEMELSIIKPFGPSPPLPVSLEPYFFDNKNSDTCINIKDLMSYRLSFLQYRKNFEKYIIDSYSFDYKSKKVVIGIEDSLYSLKDYLENKFIKKELPIHYLTAYDNINNTNVDNRKIELNKISNTGIFYFTKFGNEKEPTPLLICIKKTGNNWNIEKTILR